MKLLKLTYLFIILTFFFYFKKCYSEIYEKYRVKDINIEFSLGKETQNRKKAVKIANNIALKRYLNWITVQSSQDIENLISKINAEEVIKGYSIENEKFTKDKYSALITINFDILAIKNFLEKEKIKFSLLKGNKTLIIPLMNVEDRYILWDNPNPWFDAWMRRPLDSNLTEFILPRGDIDDLITLNSEDAKNLELYKIKNMTNKYNADKTIVLLLSLKRSLVDYTLNLTAYEGLTKNEINLENLQLIKLKGFKETLSNIANVFSNFYDDIWVNKNLKELEISRVFANIEIKFNGLEQWIKIKNLIENNKRVTNFKLLSISNNRATVFLEILSQNMFFKEIEEENLNIIKENDIWIISLNKD